MSNKICRVCNIDQPLSAFRLRQTGTYRHECRDCGRALLRANYAANPEKARARNNAPGVKAKANAKRIEKQTKTPHLAQEQFFRTRYGIDFATYSAMLSAQQQVCAICQQPETYKRNGKTIAMSVDHCHTTGKVRGLLCSNCNRGIGMLKDSPAILLQAIAYLQK